MSDELELLQELCADFVSEKRYEPVLVRLFRQQAGVWLALDNLCEAASIENPAPKAVAAWLPAPDEPDYAVVLWFDPQTQWSATALYNMSRLRNTSGFVGSGAA